MKKEKKQLTLGEQKYQEILMVQLFRLLASIVIGALGGYLVYRFSEKNGDKNILYFVVIFALCLMAFDIGIFSIRSINESKMSSHTVDALQ